MPDNFFVKIYVLVAVISTAIIAFFGLLRAARRSGVSPRWFVILSFIFVLYYSILGVLAQKGFFADFSRFPPRIFVMFVIGAIFIGTLAVSRNFQKILAQVPLTSLVEFQMFRFLAEILLFWLATIGAAPEIMTFKGRNFDVIIPLTAPIVSFLLLRRKITNTSRSRMILLAWNLAGIAVLTNTIVTAVLSMPTPAQVFKTNPSFTVAADFPFFLLPAFWVVLAYALHIFSIQKLWAYRFERAYQAGGGRFEKGSGVSHGLFKAEGARDN